MGGTTGLKGSRLPMNSQFRRMHSFIKRRAQDHVQGNRNILQAQATPSAHHVDQFQDIALNSERGTIIGLIETSPHGSGGQAGSPRPETAHVDADEPRPKQSILVVQSQALDDDDSRSPQRKDTVLNAVGQLSAENLRQPTPAALARTWARGKEVCRADNADIESKLAMYPRPERGSRLSSPEGAYEPPLSATMAEAAGGNLLGGQG